MIVSLTFQSASTARKQKNRIALCVILTHFVHFVHLLYISNRIFDQQVGNDQCEKVIRGLFNEGIYYQNLDFRV